MVYLSQLLGTPVEDSQGVHIGKISDVLGSRFAAPSPSSGSTSVQVQASTPTLVIEGQDEHTWHVPVEDVEWHDDTLRLRIPPEQLSTQPPEASELSNPLNLPHDVLANHVISLTRKQ